MRVCLCLINLGKLQRLKFKWQCFFFSASEFIRKLDKLHRDINQTTALIQEPSPENMINMPRVRAAMDLCIE